MGHASVRPSVGVQSVKASDGATGKFVHVCTLCLLRVPATSWHANWTIVVTKYWPIDHVLTKLELVGCFSAGNATVANQSNASGSLNASTNSSVYIPGTLSNPGPMRWNAIHMLNNFWTLTWSQLESQINEVWGSCQCFVHTWDCSKIVSTQHNIELWCMMQWAICPSAEHNSSIMKAFELMQWCFSRRSTEAAGAFASPKQEQGHWKWRDVFKAFQGDKSQQESKR